MSLALAAQHLAAKGRHGDSTLVHMTPGEVAGLQALARAHGQTLTINPETGLPEAFSLKSLLPMLGGAALSMIPGVGPVMAAGIMGGGTALATGSLQKGLMAGLGAYGGAGIGGALAGAGASAANTAASNAILSANPGLTAGEIGREMGTAGFVQPQLAANVNPATMSMTDKLTAGFRGLGTEAGRSAVMEQMGGLKGLAKYGGAALSPFLMAQSDEANQRPGTDGPTRFEFNAGATGAVQRPGAGPVSYFNPRLRQMAEGGSTGMTGQSDEYYRYLMGLAPMPAAYVAPVATPVNLAPLPEVTPQINSSPRGREIGSIDGPGPDDPDNNPNSWGTLTPLEKASFYSMNPGYAKASDFLQDVFGRTALGAVQNYFVPGFVQQEKDIVSGKLLNDYMKQYDYFGNPLAPTALAAMSLQDQANINAQGSYAEGQVDTGPMGGNGADNDDAGIGAAIAAAEANAVAEGMSSVAESSGNPDGPSSAGDYARGGLSSLAAFARGGYNRGGYNLGDYSDGGRLLRGPGDGVSDSIPASIGNKRPARLADGEFVVPARIVSELGNGSTEAGARQLYAMMDRIQRARKKSVGKGKVAVNSRASKLLPA